MAAILIEPESSTGPSFGSSMKSVEVRESAPDVWMIYVVLRGEVSTDGETYCSVHAALAVARREHTDAKIAVMSLASA